MLRNTFFVRALSCIVLLAIAVTARESHVVHERRERLPPGWVKHDVVNASQLISLRIALAQRNLENAELYMMAVSHPGSARYGHHWTPEQVVETFGPSEETVRLVLKWLEDTGIERSRITQSDNKGWLALYTTLEESKKLLHTEFFLYEHKASGFWQHGCDEYSVPEAIQHHIDYITPGIRLLPPQTHRHKFHRAKLPTNLDSSATPSTRNSHLPPALRDCDKALSPDCIRALYDIPSSHPPINASNKFGIYEQGSYYDQNDLNVFFTKYKHLNIPNGTHPLTDSIDGGVANATFKYIERTNPEAILDLAVAYPLVYPQKIVIFATGDKHYGYIYDHKLVSPDGFNTFLDAIDGSYCTYKAYGEKGDDPKIDPTYPDKAPNGYKGKLECGVFKPTNVISISFGGAELELPAFYQKRMCNEFMKLGLRGHTITTPSGDTGAAQQPAYTGSEGERGCVGPKQNVFSPEFPSNCPWVTAVGATEIPKGHTVRQPESAANEKFMPKFDEEHYSSGGGFSNIYARPEYQDSAVRTFLVKHGPKYKSYSEITNNTAKVGYDTPPGALFNRIGRGIPDVAANGLHIEIPLGGMIFNAGGGTSASSPIFASVIQRINEHRLAAGKPTVGFVNPVLYQNPHVLNDITNGHNGGCGNRSTGYATARGWDPVTGLGTPNFPKMLKLFMSLP